MKKPQIESTLLHIRRLLPPPLPPPPSPSPTTIKQNYAAYHFTFDSNALLLLTIRYSLLKISQI